MRRIYGFGEYAGEIDGFGESKRVHERAWMKWNSKLEINVFVIL